MKRIKGRKDDLFSKLVKKYRRRHGGKYVAVVNQEVVAVGSNRYLAYKKASMKCPDKEEVGVYYIPTRQDLLTALSVLSLLRNFKG